MRSDLLKLYYQMLEKAEPIAHLYRNDIVLWDLIYLATIESERLFWVITDSGSHIAENCPKGIDYMIAVWDNYGHKPEIQCYSYDIRAGLQQHTSEQFIAILRQPHGKDLAALFKPVPERVFPVLPELTPPLARAMAKLVKITSVRVRPFYVNEDDLKMATTYLKAMQPETFWVVWNPFSFRIYQPNNNLAMMAALDDACNTHVRAFVYAKGHLQEIDQQAMQTLIACRLDPTLFAPKPKIALPLTRPLIPGVYSYASR